MIPKPDIPAYKRLLAIAILLLFPFFILAQATPFTKGHVKASVNWSGLLQDKSEYYRNLMMQDIALPQQKSQQALSFSIEFSLDYQLLKISDKKFELVINPRSVECSQVEYFNFDISSFIKPTNATISFKLKNSFGYIEDSVLFKKIPFDTDSSLYVTRTFTSDVKDPELVFSRLKFNFNEDAYDYFRDHITVLDDYFAAAAVLDSVIVWTDRHYPSGTTSVWGNYLQQLETDRILHRVVNSGFMDYIATTGKDPAGLHSLIKRVSRKRLRTQTILERQLKEELDGINKHVPDYWLREYFNWLKVYRQIAGKVDHRYSSYFTGLGELVPGQGMIVHQEKIIKTIFKRVINGEYLEQRLPLLAKWFMQAYVAYGDQAEATGNIVLAMECFQNADAIARSFPGFQRNSLLQERVTSLRAQLAQSYLNLAAVAASKGNISLAEAFFSEAMQIFDGDKKMKLPPGLVEFEQQLYAQYFIKAEKLADEHSFSEALEIADYLQEKCSMGKYKCTGSLKALITRASEGLYLQLLSRAGSLLKADEPEECREYLQQAIDIRWGSVGLIPRDRREVSMVSQLNQMAYDEDVQEGKRFLNYQQEQIALYYFNQARELEATDHIKVDPGLASYTKLAARPVILARIDAAKVKARGYYFEESWVILNDCMDLTREYGLQDDPGIGKAIKEVEQMLRSTQCKKQSEDYSALIQQVRDEMKSGEYAVAQRTVNKALEMVLDDTVCEISDQEAWYLRAGLEYPAEYKKLEEKAIHHIPGDPEGFVMAYKEAEKYYKEMGLAKQDIVMVPMFDKVMKQEDRHFLEYMLLYYFNQKDKEKTVAIMKRLWAVQHVAPPPEQQEYLARWIALKDAEHCADPMSCLNDYTPNVKEFHPFRKAYKKGYVKARR